MILGTSLRFVNVSGAFVFTLKSAVGALARTELNENGCLHQASEDPKISKA